jgi:hypothetical protein
MAIDLKPDEQELLQFELSAFLPLLTDAARPRYEALSEAVAQGVLPDEGLEPVGDLLEVGFQTGRIRKLHRAPGEQALLRLFEKTPAGQALSKQTADLNTALGQLAGQTVESLRVLTRVPGVYLLQVATDTCTLTLRFSPDGAGVESVALGD